MAKIAEDYYNIEKLVGVENFEIWKFQIKVLFRANEVIEIATTETEGERNGVWKKKDAVAQKIIISTIDKKPFLNIMECDTSYQMWTKICNTYGRDTEQQRCKLLQEFYNVSFNKGIDMSTYINDNMVISKLLATLPKEYSHFVSAWESTETERKTLDNLLARLLGEEQRRHPKEEEEGGIAFKASQKKCHICSKVGHLAKFCKLKALQKDKKQSNHVEKDCFFRNKKQTKVEDSETSKLALLTSSMTEDTTSWIVDSGSTLNLTNNKNFFKDLRRSSTVINVAKMEQSMQAKGEGRIEFENCSMKKALFVPDLSANLLSVSSITENGGEVIFKEKEVIIKSEDGELKGEKLSNGLFKKIEKIKQEYGTES
ncbi:PREDICTED: uncharacterized protein LOC108774708 [Cyphomyrmex costatus]|uniref:uncharacterized protein LOC108774708 n=1 Tax=Cyphomyrmex costatus TaxID=456900 RepID=UPI0008522A68|nr:PREDICTED: uncharacterized protein LOC108774708 [Cyphomyrmex costatus]